MTVKVAEKAEPEIIQFTSLLTMLTSVRVIPRMASKSSIPFKEGNLQEGLQVVFTKYQDAGLVSRLLWPLRD